MCSLTLGCGSSPLFPRSDEAVPPEDAGLLNKLESENVESEEEFSFMISSDLLFEIFIPDREGANAVTLPGAVVRNDIMKSAGMADRRQGSFILLYVVTFGDGINHYAKAVRRDDATGKPSLYKIASL